MTTHFFQLRFADAEQYWLITLTFLRTGCNTSSRASCSSDCSWTLSNCRPITFSRFTSPSNGVASPISSFRHFDTEIESPANSQTSAVSSSFVVHCAENGSLFDLQACQPVECNPMPAVRYISPMVQVGCVNQQNLVLQCVDGYSDGGTAGYDTSLSSSCSKDASWTLSNCRPWHSAVSRHLQTVFRHQHPRSPESLTPRSTWLAHRAWKA